MYFASPTALTITDNRPQIPALKKNPEQITDIIISLARNYNNISDFNKTQKLLEPLVNFEKSNNLGEKMIAFALFDMAENNSSLSGINLLSIVYVWIMAIWTERCPVYPR